MGKKTLNISKVCTLLFICFILSAISIETGLLFQKSNTNENKQSKATAKSKESDKSSDEIKSIGKIIPRWREGEKKNYKMIETRKRMVDGQLRFNYAMNMDIEIEILKILKDGYRISWNYGDEGAKLNDQILETDALIKIVSNILKGYKIIFDADSDFTNYDVQNWQEIKEKYEEMVESIAKEKKKNGVDENSINTICNRISSIFSNKEQIEIMCTREARLFFIIYGLDFTETDKIEYEDIIQNPFGGDPFTAKASFTLTEVNTKKGTATIIWNQKFDKEKAGKILEKTIQDLLKEVDADNIPKGIFESVIIEDEAEFVFDINTGWLRNITHKRLTQIFNDRQEETLKFEGVK